MKKPRLVISFSGGRSSAVMTKLCLEKYGATHDIVVIFANTGCEHLSTLDFVRDCDTHWGFNTVWLEAVVFHGQEKSSGHRVVSYETASRHGEPFAEVIAKYGMPNPNKAMHCTRELKKNAVDSYLRAIGWKFNKDLDHQMAIGIRADEIDRMSKRAASRGLIYPLVELGWTKDMVNAYMRHAPFDLQLPNDAFGNCVWCWKKSLRKLMTVAKADPSAFDFPRRMESKYGQDGTKFFRGNRSSSDIIAMSQLPFEPYEDSRQRTIWDELLDIGGACSDGCEIGHG